MKYPMSKGSCGSLRRIPYSLPIIHCNARPGLLRTVLHILTRNHTSSIPLPIALGHTLQLVLLLDSIRVTASLCRVDQLLGQTLSDTLDVPERGFTCTDGEEGNSLVDTTERRHIDSLSSDGTGAANSGAVFTRTAVDDGIDGDLDGVLVGHDVDLDICQISEVNECLA